MDTISDDEAEEEHLLEDEFDEVAEGAVMSFGAFLFERILLVLLAFVVPRVGSAGLYGLVSVLRRFEGVVRGLLGGFQASLSRTLPRLEGENQDAIISVVFPVVFVLWVIFSGVILLSRGWIVEWTILSEADMGVLGVFVLFLGGSLFVGIIVWVLQAVKLIKWVHILSTLGRPFVFLSGVVVVGFVGWVQVGIYEMWVVSTVLLGGMMGVGFWVLLRDVEYRWVSPFEAKEVVGEFLEYSFYTSFIRVLGIMQTYSVVGFMAVFLSPVTAGAFGLGLVLGNITRWPLRSVNVIFPQIATKLYSDGSMEQLNHMYQVTSKTIMLCSVPILAVFVIFTGEVVGLFSGEYLSYASIVVVLSLGQLIASVFGSVGLLLLMTDNERILTVVQAGLSMVAVPMYYFLVVEYGVVGLAVGYAVILFFNNALELGVLWYFEKLWPFTWQHIAMGGIASVVFGGVYGISMVTNMFWLSSGLFILGVGCFIGISVRFVLDDTDIEFLKLIGRQFKVWEGKE